MALQMLNNFKEEVKVGFIISISEKIFSRINIIDEQYVYAREALDKCWIWVESDGISGDDLYELIDNAEGIGISEFAEDEENINIAKAWLFLVDTVSYTAWNAYKKENTKYLPQALEGIKEESFIILLESAVETSFITKDEIAIMEQRLLLNYQTIDEKRLVIRDDFIRNL